MFANMSVGAHFSNPSFLSDVQNNYKNQDIKSFIQS